MLGDIEVTVIAVMIKADDYVTYEVSWFTSGDRKSAWVEEFELSMTPEPERRMGIRAGSRQCVINHRFYDL